MSCFFIQGESLDMISFMVNIINQRNLKRNLKGGVLKGPAFLWDQVNNFLTSCFGLKPTLT